MTAVEVSLWIIRIGGLLIAGIWAVALVNVRAREPFDGRGRAEVVAVSFIVVGLAAFVVSFIPLGGF